MPKEMSEVEFEELICNLWQNEGEVWEKEYQKTNNCDPIRFKTFVWGARLMAKHFGIEIKR